WVGSYFTRKQAREEIELLERPWIGRQDIVYDGALLEDGDFERPVNPGELLTGDPVTTHIFKLGLQNYGKMPALEFTSGYGIATPPPNVLAEPGDEFLERVTMSERPLIVMPGEKITMDIRVPVTSLPRFFIVGRVRYSYPGGAGFNDFIVEYDGLNFIPRLNRAG